MYNDLRPKLTVRFYTEEKCFGPGVARLLEKVSETHSLRAAAKSMDMSYSKAWTIVKTAERELGFSLLDTTVGGKRGGGAELSKNAVRLLTDYRRYTAALCKDADALFEKTFGWLNETKK